MNYTKGSTVRIKGTGGKGVIGDTSKRQFRVDLPDGRFGWHYPEEIEPCELDFQAEQKRFCDNVRLENHLTRMSERPAPTDYDISDMAPDSAESQEE